jgi:iron complex outermembrane recepter protein
MTTAPYARWATRLASCLLAAVLVPVWAQTAPAPAASAPASNDQVSVDRVVVTANRRPETAQKVSGVVQTVSGDQLRKDGIVELRQIQQAIPGLNIANQEGNIEIFIRGVGSANSTELGDPGAAPHLNGIYIPRPRGLGMMFYDLERVEVNKGPQGTLYGRNAMAGTLNLITAKPRLGQFGGYVQAEGGSRSNKGAEAAFNLPLGERMALRLALTYTDRDYGFNNYTADAVAQGRVTGANLPFAQRFANNKPAGLEENSGGRLSWRWDASDALRFSAMVDSGKEKGTGYPGVNISEAVKISGLRPEELDLRNVVYRGHEGTMSNKLSGVQAKAEADLGLLSAEFSISQRKVDYNQRNASAESVDYPNRNYDAIQWDNFSTVYWQSKSTSDIYELRFFDDDPKSALTWSAGAFHFEEEQSTGFLSLQDRGYCCYSGTEFTMPLTKGKSTALFADGTFKLSDSTRMLGGLRYTEESKYREGIGGNIALTLGGATASNAFQCCIGSRFGTEGFQPALLARPSFNVVGLTREQQAQIILQGSLVPGARDTFADQIGSIANGTSNNGTCFTRSDIDNGFVSCPPGGAFSFANLTIPEQQLGSSKNRYGDFRLGVEHEFNRDNMLYGKVSTGHKSGGFNDSFKAVNNGIPETFEPERLTSLELGWRSAFDLAGRRAVFNITGFAYDYKNQVFQDLTCISFDNTRNPPCTGYSLVNRNIGASKLTGLELETRLPLPAGFKVDLNAAFLDSKITKGTLADYRAQDFSDNPIFGLGQSPNIGVVGNELPLVSKFSMAARLQQVFALGSGRFDWQVLVSYRSAYFLTPFNETVVDFGDPARPNETSVQGGFADRQKAYTTVNVGLGYTLGSLRVEVYGNNVTDVQASQKAIVGNGVNIRFLNDARTYGLRARLDF